MAFRAPADVFLHRAQVILILAALVPTMLTTPIGVVLLVSGDSSAVTGIGPRASVHEQYLGHGRIAGRRRRGDNRGSAAEHGIPRGVDQLHLEEELLGTTQKRDVDRQVYRVLTRHEIEYGVFGDGDGVCTQENDAKPIDGDQRRRAALKNGNDGKTTHHFVRPRSVFTRHEQER